MTKNKNKSCLKIYFFPKSKKTNIKGLKKATSWWLAPQAGLEPATL